MVLSSKKPGKLCEVIPQKLHPLFSSSRVPGTSGSRAYFLFSPNSDSTSPSVWVRSLQCGMVNFTQRRSAPFRVWGLSSPCLGPHHILPFPRPDTRSTVSAGSPLSRSNLSSPGSGDVPSPSAIHVGARRPFPRGDGWGGERRVSGPVRSAISHSAGAPGLSRVAGWRGWRPGPPPPPGRELTFSEAGAASTTTVPLPASAASPGIGRGGGGGEAGTTAAAPPPPPLPNRRGKRRRRRRPDFLRGSRRHHQRLTGRNRGPWRRGALLRLRSLPAPRKPRPPGCLTG